MRKLLTMLDPLWNWAPRVFRSMLARSTQSRLTTLRVQLERSGRWSACLITSLSDAVAPSRALWPWLLGVMAYGTLLGSPQGVALAAESQFESPLVFFLILGSGLLTAGSCALALIATNATALASGKCHSSLWSPKVIAIWVAAISCAQALILAAATAVTAHWMATGALLATVGFCAWKACGARVEHRTYRLLQHVTRYRLRLALATSAAAIAPLTVGAMIVQSTPMGLGNLGPLVVGLLGFATLSALFGSLLVTVPQCLGTWWAGAAFLVASYMWTALGPVEVDQENPLLVDARKSAQESQRADGECKAVPETLSLATARASISRKRILVSAEGGGIRAAYWAAMALSTMDVEDGGSTLDDVAMVSGVSGGSLGVAAWLAARERQDVAATERRELLRKYLASDFLSPLLGGLIFLDVPKVAFGPMWFSARRDHVFEKALAQRWRQIGNTNFFERPWAALCIRGFQTAPAVFFNATDARTGAYVPISRTRIASSEEGAKGFVIIHNGLPYDDELELEVVDLTKTTLALATVAQAVHISARFPYLSPAAAYGRDAISLGLDTLRLREQFELDLFDPPGDESRRKAREQFREKLLQDGPGLVVRSGLLVDGGYFDNTGLVPSMLALEAAQQDAERAKDLDQPRKPVGRFIRLLHLSNSPVKLCDKLEDTWKEGLSGAARTLIEVTGSHPRCAHEVLALEESLRPVAFDWLRAPIETMLSTREAHSRLQILRAQRAARASDLALWTSISAGVELREASTGDRVGRDLVKSLRSTASEPPFPSGHLEYLQKRGGLTQAQRLSVEQASIAYREAWSARAERAACDTDIDKRQPPLGWTLDASSRKLLDCLAVRGAIRTGAGKPEHPKFLLPPSLRD